MPTANPESASEPGENLTPTLITISDMAKIHGISRQTLIHYDKIDLFKPENTQTNGYRYYNLRQVPLLREICFLRNLDFSVEDIKEHLKKRTPEKAAEFFSQQLRRVDDEISGLQKIREDIKSRLNIYTSYDEYHIQKEEPAIRYFVERKVLIAPWESDISREKLHYSMMRSWRNIIASSYQPAQGWGSIFRRKALLRGDLTEGASTYIMLPYDVPEVNRPDVLVLPAGNYVTMFKYGMPYNFGHLKQLLVWMEERGYTPCGDAVDACILDTTFYSDKIKEDFCQLQIPIAFDGDD